MMGINRGEKKRGSKSDLRQKQGSGRMAQLGGVVRYCKCYARIRPALGLVVVFVSALIKKHVLTHLL